MKREWSIRAYREGDEEGIYQLDQAVHPSEQYDRDGWMRWWRWMYKENPAGKGLIWLAEDKDKIVGQYAVIPVAMKSAAQVILGAQSIATMTHPDYRRQGMFEELARITYHEAAKAGIRIIYGFPNQFSRPGFINKLDWFDISTMKIMLRPLNWKKYFRSKIKSKIKNRFLSGFLAVGATLLFDKILFRTREAPAIDRLAITQVTSFDERFDRLWAKVSGQYPIMVVRNKDYLNWRFSAPGKHYLIFAAEKANEVLGYLVLYNRIPGNIKYSFMFDMIAESEEVMRCLVSEAVKVCQREGVDFISYRLIADST